MRTLLAIIFKSLFRIKFFRARFFGFHKRIFKPYNLFKGVSKTATINGWQMKLHIDDWIQENLYFLGHYEHAELKAIEPVLQEQSVFIDIGANIGLFTLYASKFIGEAGQIISFEPFSENFKALTQNLTLNNLSSVRVEKMAIGEKEGHLNLYYDHEENNLGMVSAKRLESSVEEKVNMISVDTYLGKKPLHRIDLIKIDIEGFEYPALLGMRKTLSTFHPSLLIELLDDNNSSNNKEQCEYFLKEFGYQKYYIDDIGNLSKNEANPNRKNYFFTTKEVITKL